MTQFDKWNEFNHKIYEVKTISQIMFALTCTDAIFTPNEKTEQTIFLSDRLEAISTECLKISDELLGAK